MSIKYQLRPGLTEEHQAQGILIAKSSTALRIDKETFIQEIIRQGTTARKADVEAVLANLGVAIAALCGRGESVTIPGFGIITPRVCGTMNAQREWINKPKPHIGIRFDTALEAAFQSCVQLEEIEPVTIRPIIHNVQDVNTGTANDKLSTGGMVGVMGKHLKFHPLMGDEGIFLVPVAEGEAVKVLRYLDNRPTRLTFEVPAGLNPGDAYTLEVRSRKTGCKTLRTSDYATHFTVA